MMMARLPPALTVRRGRFAAGMICRLVPKQMDTSCSTASHTADRLFWGKGKEP